MLERAATEGRIVVTHDVSTFAGLVFERTAADLPTSGGVTETPESVPRSVTIDEPVLIAGASEPGDWDGCVVYVPLR